MFRFDYALISRISLPIVSLLLIASCGGGGGGSSDSGQVSDSNAPTSSNSFTSASYTGNTNAASLDESNAAEFVLNILGESGIELAIDPAIASTTSTSSSTRLTSQGIEVDESGACDNASGSFHTEGLIDENTYLGSITTTFSSCKIDGVTFNNQIVTKIQRYDFADDEVSKAKLTFTNLSMSGKDIDASLSGSISFEENEINESETTIANFVLIDRSSNKQYKFENLKFVAYFSPGLWNKLSYTLKVQGRFYDSKEGYVDITTNSNLFYSDADDEYPSSGSILLTGRTGITLTISPVNLSNVQLALDEDGDNVIDAVGNFRWSDLTGGSVVQPAVANAGADIETPKNVEVLLDASGSTPPLGGFLRYEWISWEVIAAPVGSVATVTKSGNTSANFTPDLTGEYNIQLTINDGENPVVSDVVKVVATNTRPIARVLDNSAYITVGSSISISNSGSYDPDGDVINYQWDIVHKPVGSNAAVLNPLLAGTSFIADLPGFYEVGLTVNDGETDSLQKRVGFQVVNEVSTLCNDEIFDSSESGSIIVDYSIYDLEVLCDGWVVVADRGTSFVRLINVVTGEVDQEFEISERIGDLVVDRANNIAYVSTITSPVYQVYSIEKINLSSGEVVSISYNGHSSSLMELGEDGELFAYAWRNVMVVDTDSNVIRDTIFVDTGLANYMEYDAVNNMLYLLETGITSTEYLYQFSYDKSSASLTLLQNGGGGNYRSMALFVDAGHMAVAHEGYPGSVVEDIDIEMFPEYLGEWALDVRVGSMAFDPFNRYLAVGALGQDPPSIYFYNTDDYEQSSVIAFENEICGDGVIPIRSDANTMRGIQFSLKGNAIISYAHCLSPWIGKTKINWNRLD